jgi:hypothetical protein
MKINRDNYEAYFLDYHEGQLSPELVEEVMLFVKHNPDLKPVLNDFEAVSLVAEQHIVFEKKSSLKKDQVFSTSQVNENNYEEFLLNETEGLLNEEQLGSLEEFISINPQFEKDRRLLALTHLLPDNKIVFEKKELLKKKAIAVGAINTDTFETFMARELEGDLNPVEKQLLAEFMLYNPHLERDRKLYTHTLLSADTDIVFEEKQLLKHSVIPVRRLVYYALSAAASLALIFSIYFLLDRNNIPRSIALQNKAENTINRTKPEPATVIKDDKVATITGNPIEDIPTNSAASKKRTDEVITNVTPSNPVPEAIAVIDRRLIETLQPLSAREVTTRSYVDPQFTFIRTSQMYMNKNLELYYNLKLAEEIQYAQVNSKDKNPGKTIFNAASRKADDWFSANHTPSQREDKKNLSLWTFAELGVQTFNTLTSSELELNLQKDEQGKVVAYGLQSGLLDFEKELKK